MVYIPNAPRNLGSQRITGSLSTTAGAKFLANDPLYRMLSRMSNFVIMPRLHRSVLININHSPPVAHL